MAANRAQSGASVETALEMAKRKLADIDSTPFSRSAFILLLEMISRYIADFVSESGRIATREGADAISAKHVERASEHLATENPRKLFRHLGTIGGILLGTGLSTVMSMAMDKFTVIPTIASVLLASIGAFLTALHIAKG